MIVALVQAKADAAADPVAKALGRQIAARFLVGEKTPQLELRHLTVVLVWSERAGAGNRDAYRHLCGEADRLIIVRTDETPPPDFADAESIDWRGPHGQIELLRALDGAGGRASSRSAKSALARMAAGLFASIGLMTPAGAAAAQAPAVTAVALPGRRSESESQAEYDLTEAAPEAEAAGPAIVDLDAYRPAAQATADIAHALAAYQPPPPVEPEVKRKRQRPLNLGPF